MSEIKGSQLYSGSKLFEPLSISTGLPLDQLNFVIAQLAALIFAVFFRNVLSYRKMSVTVRHYTSLLMGVIIGYFFIGKQIYHLFVLTSVSYIAIMICSPKVVHKVVLFVSLTYLSYFHLLRLLSDSNEYVLDVTSALMIVVQRVTNVAFSLNDGLTKSDDELSMEQRRFAIKKRPTTLQFFSYLFQFPTILCGPLVFYQDYIAFIDGQNFERYLNRASEPPSPLWTVLRKLLTSIVFALLYLAVMPKFPIPTLKDDHFLHDTSLIYKMIFLFCQSTMLRFMYYHAFILSEMICIASGLGFNGFTSDGRPKWDLMSNVDVFAFENAPNIRTAFESWNVKTQIWFRRTAYDRNRRHKLFWTYLLSSVWHGFYPGYYLMFCSFAFFTLGARNVRRYIRPRFKRCGRAMSFVYDCITYITTRVIMAYMVFPFYLLEFWASIEVYKHLYFFGHILGFVAIFIVPLLPLKLNIIFNDNH